MRQRKAIHMITDAAGYTADGIVANFTLKVVALPHLSAAINTRGPAFATRQIADDLENSFDTFDQIVAGLEKFAPEFYERNAERFREHDCPELEIYACGWSAARSQPEGYLIRACFEDSDFHHDQSMAGTYRLPPNRLQKLSACCGAPGITPADMTAAKFPEHLPVEKFDPRIDGLHLFQIQRGKLSTRKDLPPQYSVGGFATLTTIREDEISQSVLARFDDKVGELIKPECIGDWAEWRVNLLKNRTRPKARAPVRERRRGADENIIAAMYHNLTTALTDIATGSKTAGAAFSNLGLQVVRTLDEMLIKIAIVAPMARALQNALTFGPMSLGSGEGSSGMMSGWFSSHHAGGIVGSEPTAMRALSPAYFAAAPRFDFGGIVSGEVPILAHRGRITPGQMAAMGSGGSVSQTISL